ncbi:MAG: SMC-Scp complex subunit ScpB [Thermoplasmata archaeon]
MSKKALLEAILFLSAKAMTERQLSEATGMSLTTARRLLSILAREYEERQGALEVTRRGRRWVLQVKEEYSTRASHMAPTSFPVGVLKTAGLIAYYQPVKQSQLVSILGTKAYDHVKKLRERGLISAKPAGRTLLLSTTSKFLDFFGLNVRSQDELKDLMAKRIGLGTDGDHASSSVIISS